MRTSAGNRAGKTLHGKMESRIIILDSFDKITNIDINLKFLTNLTAKRILVALPQAVRKTLFGWPEGGKQCGVMSFKFDSMLPEMGLRLMIERTSIDDVRMRRAKPPTELIGQNSFIFH